MKLIIENKIELFIVSSVDLKYLEQKIIYIQKQGDQVFILEQKCNHNNRTITKIMQIIEWYSKESLIIRWFPDPKFYIYTESYFTKVYGNKQ